MHQAGRWLVARPRATAVVNRMARYALVVTLKGRRIDIDLHTPISIAVQPPAEIELPLDF